ncbi:MAG: DUF4956 domain-containing protein [Clostridia bacterium]|nr:DUF4956 domain-containing protein [Clostridia bacterium]
MNTVLDILDLTELTVGEALLLLLSSVGLSLLITLVYMFTHRKSVIKPAVLMTIIILGPIAGVLFLVVGNNLARAVSLGGGIALIRFRSTLNDPRDLAYLLLSMVIGITCGSGLLTYAVLVTVVVSLVLIVAHLVHLDGARGRLMKLRIIIPENMDYYGVFDPILKEHCASFHLESVRSTEYGTLLELRFLVKINDPAKQKELIDAIRCRNGNLTISLSERAAEDYV